MITSGFLRSNFDNANLQGQKTKKCSSTQENYLKKVLKRFSMEAAKSVTTPLAQHFLSSTSQAPTTNEVKSNMITFPYASVLGSIMYSMVCTRPNLAHSAGKQVDGQSWKITLGSC